ncbi:MAG: hypothetical protein ACK4F6_19380, partial [Hylemonella sp.]
MSVSVGGGSSAGESRRGSGGEEDGSSEGGSDWDDWDDWDEDEETVVNAVVVEVGDFAARLCEELWPACQALRRALLPPRPPSSQGGDAAGSTVAAGIT